MKDERWPNGRMTSDWYEVAGLMQEMTSMTGGNYSITLTACGSLEKPDLLIEGVVMGPVSPNMEVAVWGLQRFRCSGSNTASLKAAIFFLLYQLDFQLGEKDLTNASDESA